MAQASGPGGSPPELPEFIPVPAGDFWMGREHGPDNERPRRRVRVDAFHMMRAPVSRAQYAAFLEETGHEGPPCWDVPYLTAPDQPATGVSWHDADAFAAWLRAKTGRPARLPTEAEREWASRGGRMDVAYPWGDEVRHPPYGPLGWGPPLLGATEPNGFGLLHMADGVHEWCQDWYERSYPDRDERNPTGPERGTRKAARGGSWRHQIKVTPCCARSSLPPDHRYEDFGFRLVW